MKFRELLTTTDERTFIKLVIKANGMKFYLKNYPENFLNNLDAELLDSEVVHISVNEQLLRVVLK